MVSATGTAVPGPPPQQRKQPELESSAGQKAGVAAALSRHRRRARALRELDRLIRIAPAASIRDDLMAIAARHELAMPAAERGGAAGN